MEGTWCCGVVEGVDVSGCHCALELSVGSCRAVSTFYSPPQRQQGFYVETCVDCVEPGVQRSKWCCWAAPGSASFASAE